MPHARALTPTRPKVQGADIVLKEAGKVRLVRLQNADDVGDLLALLDHVRVRTTQVA